jgi:hypothetical protein
LFYLLHVELVNIGSHVDPHDIKGLAESIEPKLMEETHQERSKAQKQNKATYLID